VFASKTDKHSSQRHGTWLFQLGADADTRATYAAQVGGKAARTAWLIEHGFHVPRTWVLGTAAFEAALSHLPPACEPRSLLRAALAKTVYNRAAEARQAILAAPLPANLEAELTALWDEVKDHAPWGLAVRSSATCEDSALVSMAGLADTLLGVRGAAELVSAVREVWASVASGRALSYLAAHGVRDLGMAVVIQPVVVASAAGVMFTRAPDKPKERIVNVAFGLGAPVVDGVASPDVYRFDAAGKITAESIAHKPKRSIVTAQGFVTVDNPNPGESSLSRERLADLAKIATALEAAKDIAWDVEFAVQDERIVVVQARPVTGGVGYPEGGGPTTVWSRVNVGEALPGVATPFTWSVAGAFSETGFRRAFASLGCRVPKNAKLVGNVYGRFYLNLTEFSRIAAQVPLLSPRALVELGGGSGAEEVENQLGSISKRGFYMRLPQTASRLIKEQLGLDAQVDEFEHYAARVVQTHASLDIGVLPDEGVARTLRDLQEVLERTGNVMLTCGSSALGAHLALKTMIARFDKASADRLSQGLVRGIRDLESARPAIAVSNIVECANREPAARAALLDKDTRDVASLPEGATRRALESFLELYGDRAVREAELSTPRWREDHASVLTMVRVALRGEPRGVTEALARAKTLADADMAEISPRLGFVAQTGLRHLVARAQKAERLRERMRAWVTRMLGLLRAAALDADSRLSHLLPELEEERVKMAERGLSVAKIPNVFFLTIDEVCEILRTARSDFGPLVRARRAEVAREEARPDPPVTFTGVPPAVVLPTATGDVLTGFGASSGMVIGRARVLFSAAEMSQLLPGEILVVRTTDVGWTPLFLMAAGVVTELGGALSHAAVVARELSVPAVVNVESATRRIRTGDLICIDGDRGTVQKTENP
jgi:pyruvate,water dikinase